jgi:hypothetical protein
VNTSKSDKYKETYSKIVRHYNSDNENEIIILQSLVLELIYTLQNDLAKRDQLLPSLMYAKYSSYTWNYERLTGESQAAFLHRFYDEFLQHWKDGVVQRPFFPWYSWNDLQMLMLDPDRYHDIQSRKLAGEPAEDFYDAYPKQRPIKGKIPYYLVENLSGASHYLSEEGFFAVVNLFVNKVKSRIVSGITKEKV